MSVRFPMGFVDRTVLIAIFSSLCLICQAVAADASPLEKKAKSAHKNAEPIEITSDRLDAYSDKGLVIFSGNAVATQGPRVIKADRLLFYYRKKADNPKIIESKAFDGSGDLERVEARGNVLVTESDRVLTGNEAVFFQDTRKIVTTGNAVMREGDNVIHGETIVYFLDEKRGVVESAGGKRVTATIYPREAKENKK